MPTGAPRSHRQAGGQGSVAFDVDMAGGSTVESVRDTLGRDDAGSCVGRTTVVTRDSDGRAKVGAAAGELLVSGDTALVEEREAECKCYYCG